MIRLPSCYDHAIFIDIFCVLSRTRAYIIYYAHARMRKLLPKCLFILVKNYRCWLSVTYKENAKISQKSCLEIWSIQKKAVPLQPISQQTQVSAKERRKVLKIAMLIISHLRRKWKKIEKSCLKIWSVQKKAVPLQPISQQTRVSVEKQQKSVVIFESLINQWCSTRE